MIYYVKVNVSSSTSEDEVNEFVEGIFVEAILTEEDFQMFMNEKEKRNKFASFIMTRALCRFDDKIDKETEGDESCNP